MVTVAAHSLHANNANPVFTTGPRPHASTRQYLQYRIRTQRPRCTVISIYVNGYLTLARFQLKEPDANVIATKWCPTHNKPPKCHS